MADYSWEGDELAKEDTPRSEPVGGVDYPRNWHGFLSFVASDEQCLAYLARLRWPDGFRCPACRHDRYWYRGDDRYLCCSCRHKTSVTAGTLFAGTRLGLRTWFAAAWYVVHQTNGVSALGSQRVLGFGSYETAWAWLHKLRRAMVPTSGKLTGNVEADESYVGGVEPAVPDQVCHCHRGPVPRAARRCRPGSASGAFRTLAATRS